MIKDFKKLMENEEDIEALYKKPTKEIIYPHAYITDTVDYPLSATLSKFCCSLQLENFKI